MSSEAGMHSTAVAPGTVRTSSILEHFLEVRETSMRLCAPLSVEDHALQPMPDASPAKWHLAHTTWFFETFVLSKYADQFRSYHPVFRNLFNSYYNTIGDRPLRNLRHVLSRPSLEEVHAYRGFVDDSMAQLLTREIPNDALELITLGMNHEQQHQELIVTDVKNGLWTNPLRPAYRDDPYRSGEGTSGARASQLQWHNFAEGIYPIGFAGEGFAFDNETPQHKVYLDGFRLASRLITNGEYLEFMRDGGYATPTLWLSDGWDCVRNNQWSAPLYWEQREGEWWVYTVAGMQPLKLDEPVCHVSFYEADAFAHWAGARLATEFEWEIAAGSAKVEGNLLESGALHPEAAPEGNALTQLFGDVWEWTASAYNPYPGFKTAPGAVGEYNGKFMCNQMVLRGGSCATPRSHIRASYRNFFPPHVRWQFMGIRLANGN
jgi:ergothioneine biosynthesis protein EgtB